MKHEHGERQAGTGCEGAVSEDATTPASAYEGTKSKGAVVDADRPLRIDSKPELTVRAARTDHVTSGEILLEAIVEQDIALSTRTYTTALVLRSGEEFRSVLVGLRNRCTSSHQEADPAPQRPE
jgi:hypothetical protein